jgi:hypothetical protein
VVWIWHYGEIPTGKYITFLNNNTLDTRIENLCVKSTSDVNVARNIREFCTKNGELRYRVCKTKCQSKTFINLEDALLYEESLNARTN